MKETRNWRSIRRKKEVTEEDVNEWGRSKIEKLWEKEKNKEWIGNLKERHKVKE